MSRMGSTKAGRRARRQFSEEFRIGAVRLVLDEGKTVGAVARELDLTPSALAQWVRQARADRTKGKTGLTTEERAELARLRKDNRELRMERDVLTKAAAFFAKDHPVKFAWIQTEKATYPLTKLCRWLDVTRSGFYAWRARPASPHAREDRRLTVLVRASFEASQQRYGSPRVHEDLLEQEEHVSRKRVVRLMQNDGLKARRRKRYKLTTISDHDQPVAANLGLGLLCGERLDFELGLDGQRREHANLNRADHALVARVSKADGSQSLGVAAKSTVVMGEVSSPTHE